MTQIPVDYRAMAARINGRLPKGQRLKSTHPRSQAEATVGRFYIVDAASGQVVRTHIDLTELARELDAMQPYERVSHGASTKL